MRRMSVKDERRYGGLNERGAAMVFVAVSLLGLLAMVAFSFDFGRVYVERRELQVGAESAARRSLATAPKEIVALATTQRQKRIPMRMPTPAMAQRGSRV